MSLLIQVLGDKIVGLTTYTKLNELDNYLVSYMHEKYSNYNKVVVLEATNTIEQFVTLPVCNKEGVYLVETHDCSLIYIVNVKQTNGWIYGQYYTMEILETLKTIPMMQSHIQ